MMEEKVKIELPIGYFRTISNLVFDISKVLEEEVSYEVLSSYNKQILNCKNDTQRLKTIVQYVIV